MKRLISIVIFIGLVIPAISQKRIASVRSKDEILNEKYCSGMFDTQTGDYFDLLEGNNLNTAMGYRNILDWLKGRVAGLQVYQNRNGISVPYLRSQLAAVFVDEMRMSYDYLLQLPITDIAMVKVIKGPFLGGWGAAGGAIAIYTIRGDEE